MLLDSSVTGIDVAVSAIANRNVISPLCKQYITITKIPGVSVDGTVGAVRPVGSKVLGPGFSVGHAWADW